MKIIKNPENGGVISNIWLDSVKYFPVGQEFKPGDIVKVEDKLGTFLVELYRFLEELTKEQAVKYLESKKDKKFKCDKCDFTADLEIALMGHVKKHEKEARLDDALGIPVIKGEGKEIALEKTNTQDAIEAENKRNGLDVGEGLVELNMTPKVRF